MWNPQLRRVGHLRSWSISLLQPLLAVCRRFRVARRTTTVLQPMRPWRLNVPWMAQTAKVGWLLPSACLCGKSSEEALSAIASVLMAEGSAWSYGVSFMKTLVLKRSWRVKFYIWLQWTRTANGISVRYCVQIVLLVLLFFTVYAFTLQEVIGEQFEYIYTFISVLCWFVTHFCTL